MAMHVINYPDSSGSACDVCQHCIQLPAYNALTMPNYPNYFLGAENNSLCDSLPTTIDIFEADNNSFLVFPDPAVEEINVKYNGQINSLSIFNSLGQMIVCKVEYVGNNSAQIKLDNFPKGLYFLKFNNQEKQVVRKFIVSN